MNIREYQIIFKPPGSDTTQTTILRLSDEHLAGLDAMLRRLVPVLKISKHLTIRPTDTQQDLPIDIVFELFDNHYVGFTEYSFHRFDDLIKTRPYAQAILIFDKYHNKAVTINDITMNYSAVFQPMKRERNDSSAELYQFNTLDFIQGALTACKWMNKDYHNHIPYIFDGQTRLELL